MKVLIGLILLTVGLAACSQPNFGLPAASENFGQSVTYNNKVDILWIVDNSTSMGRHQAALGQAAPAMVQKLNDLKMDYHMAVITTSMGLGGDGGKFMGSPAVLTNSTPNLSSVLAQRLMQGEAGANLERGIDSMLTTLSPAYMYSAVGQSFFRDDALLAIIALSDEDDQSARTLDYVSNFLDGVKPRWADGNRAWMMNFIGVLQLTNVCRTYNAYSDPGQFYMDLADISGGVKESICTDDFSGVVTNIRARIVQILTDFKLKSIPVVSSIKVYINGTLVPQSSVNGWTYESVGNLVRFHGTAVPPADAAIKVDFDPAQAN